MAPLPATAQDSVPTPPATESASVLVDDRALHAPWSQLLARYVQPGEDGVNRFDYGGLKASKADAETLRAYISTLEETDVQTLSRDAQFAYWANLYNALTIQLIIDNYPVKSIMRIRPTLISIGPWKKDITSVGGRDLSLDDIEHEILRKQWSDPRVHYAVNCASYGCPNLQTKAWVAETLSDDLHAAARDFVNHPRGVTIRRDGRLQVSTIYKWFREDFGDSEAGVIAHLLQYADPDLTEKISANPDIRDHEYDWDLNDISRNS